MAPRTLRLTILTVASVFLSAACTSADSPSPRPAPSSIDATGGLSATAVHRTYELAPGVEVYAWFAPGRKRAPWAVYIHGGAWYTGSVTSSAGVAWAQHEVPRGYQVFALNYRLSPVARWPAQRIDVATAVDWIRERAGWFGLDLARGAVVGESAGGQLAAVEASRGRFAGGVDLAGVVDPRAALTAPDVGLGAAAKQLVGCSIAACPDRWRDTQAITHVGPGTPPLLVMHAVADRVVPVSMSRTFVVQLRAEGKHVTLRMLPGNQHGLLLIPSVLRQVDAFIDSETH